MAHTASNLSAQPFSGRTIDTDKDQLADVHIEPANPQEIDETVLVMGGEDWALWLDALVWSGRHGTPGPHPRLQLYRS